MSHLHATLEPRPWLDRAGCWEKREPSIEVRELSVSYGVEPALRDVTLTIPRGCITAVVGPSGCGKSTFRNCLNRMTDLVAGCRVTESVSLEGHEITNGDTDLIALRRQWE